MNWNSKISLIISHANLFDEEKTIELAKSIVEKDNFYSYYWAAWSLNKVFCYDLAKEFAKKTYDLKPNSFLANWINGLINYDINNFTEALTFFEKAITEQKASIYMPAYKYLTLMNTEDEKCYEFFDEFNFIINEDFLVRILLCVEKKFPLPGYVLPETYPGKRINNIWKKINLYLLNKQLVRAIKKRNYSDAFDLLSLWESYTDSDVKENINNYLSLLQNDEDKKRSLFKSRILIELGEIESAELILNDIDNYSEEYKLIALDFAVSLMIMKKEYTKAEEYLNKLEAENEEDIQNQLLYYKAIINLGQNRPKEAIKFLYKVVEGFPQIAITRYWQWRRYFQNKRSSL